MKDTYNGWTNRATWLVQLHLDNTTKEVHNRSIEIAIEANTTKQYASKIRSLLTETAIATEVGYDLKKVNWRELWDANGDSSLLV